jgi:hypothetical protein
MRYGENSLYDIEPGPVWNQLPPRPRRHLIQDFYFFYYFSKNFKILWANNFVGYILA